jgi:hypothetical protein
LIGGAKHAAALALLSPAPGERKQRGIRAHEND